MTDPTTRPAGRLFQLAALGLGVTILLTVGVVIVNNLREPAADLACVTKVTRVRGIIGSEKEEFFSDQRVKNRLRCLGFEVVTDPRGSLDMIAALKKPEHGYGFAFPGSRATARKILDDPAVQHDLTTMAPYELFASPMVIASFDNTIATLRQRHYVNTSEGADVVDLGKIVALVGNGTTWAELDDNSGSPDKTPVRLYSTDPNDSNSGFLLFGLAAFTANGNHADIRSDQMDAVTGAVCPLFAEQGGSMPTTSQDLFNDYVTQNRRIKMAFVYESQYLAAGELPSGAQLMYPNPGISSTHTLIALSAAGQQLAEQLRKDEEVTRLMVKHGFRPQGKASQPDGAGNPAVTAGESPRYDQMQDLLDALNRKSASGQGCRR